MSGMMAMIRKTLGIATPATAKVAKDRLSIMLVHQRNSEALASVDMSELQKELALVVQKYIKVSQNKPAHLLGKELCILALRDNPCSTIYIRSWAA
jgi:cell division topological specificity factor MinE